MNIGSAIKSVRKQEGISQYELAEKCNISQTSLSQIENGVKRPSAKTMKKICDVLNVPESVLYLLGIQQTIVPDSRKNAYQMLFPSIHNMAWQIIGAEHRQFHEPMDMAV